MARDYAKTPKSRSKKASTRGKSTQRRGGGSGKAASNTGSGSSWRSYLAGLFSGFFVSFIIYLANLPAAENATPRPEAAPAAVAAVPAEPPKPRFDFYKMLPEQTIDGPVEPAEVAKPRAGAPQESYLLQAGSFRQRDDAFTRAFWDPDVRSKQTDAFFASYRMEATPRTPWDLVAPPSIPRTCGS